MDAVFEAQFQVAQMTRDLGRLWQPRAADRNLAAALVLARGNNDGRLTSGIIREALEDAAWGFKMITAVFQLMTFTAEFLDDPEQRDSMTGRAVLADINQLLDVAAALPPEGMP